MINEQNITCIEKRSTTHFLSCLLPSLAGILVVLFSLSLAWMGQRHMLLGKAGIEAGIWGFALAAFFFVLGFRWPLLSEKSGPGTINKWLLWLAVTLWLILAAAAIYYFPRWDFRWGNRAFIVYLAPAVFFSIGLRRFSPLTSVVHFLGTILLTVLGTFAVWTLFYWPTLGRVFLATGLTLGVYVLLLFHSRGRLNKTFLRIVPSAFRENLLPILLLILLSVLFSINLWILDSMWPLWSFGVALLPVLLLFGRNTREPVKSLVRKNTSEPLKVPPLLPLGFIILGLLSVAGAVFLGYSLRVSWPFFVLNIGGLAVWFTGLIMVPREGKKAALWTGFLLAILYQLGAIALWGQKEFPNAALVPFFVSWIPALTTTVWLDYLRRQSLPERVTPKWLTWEIVVLIIIVALASFFRFWQVEDIPYGIWADEARECRDALSWSEGKPYNPFSYYASRGTLSFNFYILGLWYKVFGFGLGSARAMVALTGVLTVLFLHFTGRLFLGRAPSLIAAAFLSTSGWHVNFTRFFMEPPLSVLFIVLCFYFLIRGLKSRRFTDFLLSGAFVGFSTITYAPSRLIPMVLVLLLLHQTFARKRFLSHFWYAPLLVVLGGQLTSCPVNVAFFTDPFMTTWRMEETSVFGRDKSEEQAWSDVQSNVREHLLMFNHEGDPNPRHGIPGAPKLNPFAAFLFGLGLLVCLFRWRYLNSGMLILWLFIGLLAGILTLAFEAPQSCRTQLVIPAVFLITAIPFVALNRQMKDVFGRWSWLPVLLLASPILFLSIRFDYDYYFNQMQNNPLVYEHFLGRDTTIARYLDNLEDREDYFFVHQQPENDYPAIPFVLRNKSIHGVVYRSPDYIPLRNATGLRLHYLLEPWRAPFPAEYFKHYYPGGEYNEFTSPYNETIFYTFTASEDEANALQGLHGEYQEVDNPDGPDRIWTAKDKGDIRVDQFRTSFPVVATWTGSFYADTTRDYRFAWSDEKPIRIAFDEEPLPKSGQDSMEVLLERGWHNVQIERRLEGDEPPFALGFKTIDKILAVPGRNLCVKPVPDFGFYARYYGNKEWKEPAGFVMIQPILSVRWHPEPIAGYLQWSAKWSAYLQVDEPGDYGFSVVCNSYCRVVLDGQTVLEQEDKDNVPMRKRIRIEKGEHELEVYYKETYQYSEMRLKWDPPKGKQQPIPFENLRPKYD